MKNLFITIVILFLFPIILRSQNLVNNPSFEDTIPCAIYPELPQLRPYFWFQPTGGSSDFFNTSTNCAWGGGAPSNVFGYQIVHTGNAYLGFEIWAPFPATNVREYIEGILTDTLRQNHTYCFEFYVSAANDCSYFTDDIGAYFSVDSVADYTNGFVLPYTPQVENVQGNILSDTLNWMLVSGSFTAQGGEKYITIGNFRDDANTTLILLPGMSNNFGYYYIDDVSVVDCTVGIEEPEKIKFSLSPNPTKDKLYINLEMNFSGYIYLEMLDIYGKKIMHIDYKNGQRPKEIDVGGLISGMYFLQIAVNGKSAVIKFLKE